MAIQYRQGPGGSHSALNITATTLITASQGWVFRVAVITAPTAAGGVYDSVTTAGAAAANQMAAIPIAVSNEGIIDLGGAPFFNGLVINPGTGGVVAVYYEPNYATPPLNITN